MEKPSYINNTIRGKMQILLQEMQGNVKVQGHNKKKIPIPNPHKKTIGYVSL